MSVQVARHRNAAPSRRWCVSDLVHALAQLPDGVTLELQSNADQHSNLELLSSAYGLEDRIDLRQTVSGHTSWGFRGASPTAPEWATDGSLDFKPPDTMAQMVESLWPSEASPSSTARDDRVLSGQRVAIVTNLPTHYRVPLFTALGRRLAGVDASLRVFFLGRGAPGRPWLDSAEGLQFDHEFLFSLRAPVRRRRLPLLPASLRRRIGAFEPTMLVAAGFSPFSSIEAALCASRRRIPFGIWSGEIPSLAVRRRPQSLRISERQWLTRRADFGIAYGSLAERYFRTLAPHLPVVIGRNTSVGQITRPRGREARTGLELLAVADLSVPGKGVEVAAEALELIRELPCRLTVIGGKPRKGPLSQAAARDSRIRFLGALPQEEVRTAYEKSDVFLFPSRADPFGLALVEAMASELAVIVSQASGAAADLAVPGRNCLLAEARSPRSWAEPIKSLAYDDALRRSISKNARETVRRRWTIAHAVEAMVAGLRLGALKGNGRGA